MKPIWVLVLGASIWPDLATAAESSIVMALSPRELPVAASLDVEAAYVLASRSYGSLGQSTLPVIAKLGEKEDLYQAASRIGEFILSAPKMDCIALRPGVALLGVDKPERYRAQLLKLIAEHIAASKAGLGSARDIEVGGLEKPVQLIQKSSREVTLFLNYTSKIRP
jgi:hypothetical protein